MVLKVICNLGFLFLSLLFTIFIFKTVFCPYLKLDEVQGWRPPVFIHKETLPFEKVEKLVAASRAFHYSSEMSKEKDLDLSEFFPETASLDFHGCLPTKYLYPSKVKLANYEKMFELDPLLVLGEKGFGEPKHIPEDVIGSPVQEYFRGANILITGGTGFVGKILTEKLVRCNPHLGHIYLLIRTKRGKTPQDRLNQLLEDQVFSRMKTEVPHYLSKITVIEGDIADPGLGLSCADRQMLIDSINIVFHSAADVRFLEPLKSMARINILGSKQVLDLGKEMKHLKSYVHVSTAFSQCVRRVIEENVPKMSKHYKEIIDLVQTTEEKTLEEETPRILETWPNTYTYSKAVCEDMIQEEAKGMPLCIVRPSVVLSSYKEPVRGWTDNLYGPIGIVVGAALGVIHSFKVSLDMTLDVVPVDFLVNFLICAAWSTGKKRSQEYVIVYNFTTGASNETYKSLMDLAKSIEHVYPYSRAVWAMSLFTTQSTILNYFCYYAFHRIPGIVFDKVAELSGEKPMLTKTYQRMRKLAPQLNYFSERSWEFKNTNVIDLWNILGQKDKQLFCFDLQQVDFQEWILVSKLGCRYYFFKDKMEDIPAAIRKYKWLYYAHKCLQLLFGLAALKLLVVTARILPI